MNTNIHVGAHQWIGVINGDIACFAGIIQKPIVKGWKTVHRLVVLPDYQGIGIGLNFINFISNRYSSDGFSVSLITSAPAMVSALRKSKKWKLINYGRSSPLGGLNKPRGLAKTLSTKRIIFSFNYLKDIKKTDPNITH